MGKRMTRRNQLLAGFFIIAVIALIFFARPAKAAMYNASLPLIAQNADYTGGWKTVELANERDVHCYKVTVPVSGVIEFGIQGTSLERSEMGLYSADMSDCYFFDHCGEASEEHPVTVKETRYVSAGVYYLKVCSTYRGYKGTYRIRALYTLQSKDGNQSMETNSFDTARTLSAGEMVNGFLSMTDSYDFYKISVPARTKVKATLKSEMTDYWPYKGSWIIWNDDRRTLTNFMEVETDGTSVYEETLEKGTYYILVYRGQGRYTLTWTNDNAQQVANQRAIANFRAKSAISTLAVRRTGAGKVTASWTRCYMADGYQFQYSTKSDMSNARSYRRDGSASKSMTAGALSRYRFGYFRVRAYKYFDGKKYFAAWSPVKSLYIR